MSRRHRIGRERYTLPQVRSRAEVITAVAGAAAVVVGTLLLVWLLRPATGPGTGGLIHRQPRAAWLIILTAGAAAAALRWAGRSRRATHRRTAIAVAMVLVGVAAVAGGALWPGGLLRHVQSIPGHTVRPTDTSLPVSNSTPGTTPQPLSTPSTAPGAAVSVVPTAPGPTSAPAESTAPAAPGSP